MCLVKSTFSHTELMHCSSEAEIPAGGLCSCPGGREGTKKDKRVRNWNWNDLTAVLVLVKTLTALDSFIHRHTPSLLTMFDLQKGKVLWMCPYMALETRQTPECVPR